jgi:hypothetical protein
MHVYIGYIPVATACSSASDQERDGTSRDFYLSDNMVLRVCVWMYICVCACVYVYVCVCVCMCVYVCVC